VLWEPVVQTDLWQRLVPWGPPGKPFAVTRGAVTTIGYHDDDLSIIPNRTFDARECARQSRRTLTTPKGRGFLHHTKRIQTCPQSFALGLRHPPPLIPENEILGTRYRHLLYGSYRIVFRLAGRTVYVLRMTHGARLLLDPQVFLS
jgi:hypothetical protein